MLAPLLEQLAKEQVRRIKVVKVDVDGNPTLCSRFGIRSIPALLYFAEGKLCHQTVGVAGKKQIADALNAPVVAA